MNRPKNRSASLHYYSDRLRQKLNELSFASSAVIEAPSGYGKTTAVKDLLESEPAQSVPVYWFTATDELPAAGFRRLCKAIDQIDSLAGQRLLRVEMPNAATIGEVCDALRSIQCRQETYLVIDDFHLMQDALPNAFFRALLEHGGNGLHLIILTNTLKRNIWGAISGQRFLHITADDLRLNDIDIGRYYALEGERITPGDAAEIARLTGGWITAVYLQLCIYREKGTFTDTNGLTGLMEYLVWDTLDEARRTFLLRVSLFETFTLRQACALNDCVDAPEYAREMLDCPFIRYEPSERRYDIHGVLQELLAAKRGERGEAFQRDCLRRAGDDCLGEGKTAKALAFYWAARDYTRALSLDLSQLTMETIGNTPFAEIARLIVRDCPVVVKAEYPLSMLQIAWALLMAGMFADYRAVMEEMRGMLENNRSEEACALMGEWLLLSSFDAFPHLSRMLPVLKQAAALLNGNCSQVILPTAPWCFGSYSPLTVYHVRPGEADGEADELAEYVALYSRLTDGSGAGADVLYRAELCFHRGDLGNAEILAYKAVYLAESKRQGVVQLGAAVLLCDIALHKADAVGWQSAIGSMERAAAGLGQNTAVACASLDIARGMLFIELRKQENVAEWLQAGELSHAGVLPPMVPNAVFVYLGYLLHMGEYARLIALGEAVVPEGKRYTPLASVLVSLHFAQGHLALGHRERAAEFVDQAVRAALEDGMYLPLALYMQRLDGMVESCLKSRNAGAWNEARKIHASFITGIKTLRRELAEEGLPENLTRRERDVARLAAQSMRNADIAQALGISPNTVKAHLKTIYEKLAIDKRSKLREKLK